MDQEARGFRCQRKGHSVTCDSESKATVNECSAPGDQQERTGDKTGRILGEIDGRTNNFSAAPPRGPHCINSGSRLPSAPPIGSLPKSSVISPNFLPARNGRRDRTRSNGLPEVSRIDRELSTVKAVQLSRRTGWDR